MTDKSKRSQPLTHDDVASIILASIAMGITLAVGYQYWHVTPVTMAQDVWWVLTTTWHTVAGWVDTLAHGLAH